MAANQEADLERFLRQQLFRNRDQPLEKFVLRNALAGARGQEVEEFEIQGTITTDQVPLMRDQILTSAQRDADGAGTKLQSYILVALELSSKVGPRFRFRVRGEGDDDEGGEEPANEKGLLAQMMRHNEAMMRMMTMGNSAIIQNLSRQLDDSNRHTERLIAQRQEGFQALEEAKSQQHEREIQLLTVGNQEERKSMATNKLVSKIEMLFPILFNKLAGQKMLTTEEHSVLGSFVESLSPEQLQRIAQQLSPEQQVSLLNMYRDIKEKNVNGVS